MSARKRLIKEDDYETSFRCAGGTGILREEVWVNEEGEVVRYNLAFLVPHLFHRDNGRILGFDNAHGVHERHYLGKVMPIEYDGYRAITQRFYSEVREWRKQYENQNLL